MQFYFLCFSYYAHTGGVPNYRTVFLITGQKQNLKNFSKNLKISKICSKMKPIFELLARAEQRQIEYGA